MASNGVHRERLHLVEGMLQVALRRKEAGGAAELHNLVRSILAGNRLAVPGLNKEIGREKRAIGLVIDQHAVPVMNPRGEHNAQSLLPEFDDLIVADGYGGAIAEVGQCVACAPTGLAMG